MSRRIATLLLVLASLAACAANAHDMLTGGSVVNPRRQAADRDNAKLNFLTMQARIHSVDADKIAAARSIYIASYSWPKSTLRICFWNGSDAQQREILQIADVWHQAVPVMSFDFLDGGKVRLCKLSDLANPLHMADIRITLTSDIRSIYNAGDLTSKTGDWSYTGREVAYDAAYPTTMNLVGSMSLKQRGLLPDYYFNVRHEFGHALSLVHEHQRRVCDGWFNIPQIAHDTGWSIKETTAQVAAIDESSNVYSTIGGYDIESIMQYNFNPSWYAPDKPGQPNPCRRQNQVVDLSELDKYVIAAIYQPSLNQTPERQALIAKSQQGAAAPIQIAASAPAQLHAAAAPVTEIASAVASPHVAVAPRSQASSVEMALAAFSRDIGKVSPITVQVYPHESDKSIVLKALANLGYPLTDASGHVIRTISHNTTAMLRGDPTNAVLFTADVSEQDVRYVALALHRAGIEVKSIQPYYPHPRNKNARRAHLIQVGADVTNRNRLALSEDDILRLPLPMYGQKIAAK